MKLLLFCILKNSVFLGGLASKIQPWGMRFKKERYVTLIPIFFIITVLTLTIYMLPPTILERSISMTPLTAHVFYVICFLISTIVLSIIETPLRWILFRLVEWHKHHKRTDESNKTN